MRLVFLALFLPLLISAGPFADVPLYKIQNLVPISETSFSYSDALERQKEAFRRQLEAEFTSTNFKDLFIEALTTPSTDERFSSSKLAQEQIKAQQKSNAIIMFYRLRNWVISMKDSKVESQEKAEETIGRFKELLEASVEVWKFYNFAIVPDLNLIVKYLEANVNSKMDVSYVNNGTAFDLEMFKQMLELVKETIKSVKKLLV